MIRVSQIASSLAVLSFMLISCKSDLTVIPPSSFTSYIPSDSAKIYFLPDATDYAIGHLFIHSSADTSNLFIPDSILNIYLLPLASLYDGRRRFPLLDTLLVQRQIHMTNITCQSLRLELDTSFVWVQNVINGISPTGDTRVDSLAQLCKLRFGALSVLLPGYALSAAYFPPLNTSALSEVFHSIPGVISATPQYLIYYNSKLSMVLSPSEATIRLYYGYGDCLAGCFGYDRWTFTVSNTFDVEYKGYVHQ